MSLKKYNEKRKFDSTPEPKAVVNTARKNKSADVNKTKTKNSKSAKASTLRDTTKNSRNNTPKSTTKTAKNDTKRSNSENTALRFVVQFHKARNDHFDFRLEHNNELLSWAVPKEIPTVTGEKRLAVMVEPHPIEYIDFCGVIPPGNYGAGSVEIFDNGTYQPKFDMDYGLKKGHIRVELLGKKLRGDFSLIRTNGDNWIMLKHVPDSKSAVSKPESSANTKNKRAKKNSVDTKNKSKESASESKSKNKTDVKNTHKKSETAKTKDEQNNDDIFADVNISPKAKTKLPFKKISPMLCTLSTTIPAGKDWAFEIKYDGYRIITLIENGKVKCLTRNGKDYTAKLMPIVEDLKNIRESSFVLDGEVVSFDEDGRSDFGLLLQNLKTSQNLYYVVFDILAFRGKSLLNLPLLKRKEILHRLLAKEPKLIVESKFVLGGGKACFNSAKKLGLEGIVAKKIGSVYTESRSENWLKIKCYKSQEFVILGYTTTKENPILSAIIVGYYKGKTLHYIGKVGTGFDSEKRAELSKKLSKLKPLKQTCVGLPKTLEKNAKLVKPTLVCNVQFAEITPSGALRQPSFIGLREDKNPRQVCLEKANE